MKKMLKEKKGDGVYYLMRDIAGCFPSRFEQNFLCAISHYQIARESIKQIFKDEIAKSKPEFRTLSGCLILLDSFVNKRGRSSLYELADVLKELKFCFLETSFKTVKRQSAAVIFEMFVKMYSEYIMKSVRKGEGKTYLNQFRKLFSINEIALIADSICSRWVLERYLVIERGEDTENRMKEIFNEFYSSK